MRLRRSCCLPARCAFALALLVPATAPAAWPHDPFFNVPLSTRGTARNYPTVVADGAGGAIVVWCDCRETPAVICAQRVSADGALLWDPAGVVISFRGPEYCRYYAETMTGPLAVTDGAGGVIVAWGGWSGWDPTISERTNIVAQRVTADGTVSWGDGGIVLCNAPGYHNNIAIAADGEGGAIVAWGDQRYYPVSDPEIMYESDVFAQRVSADGVAQWAANGKAVFVGAGLQRFPVVAGDGAGGAIIAWIDYASGFSHAVARAQRLSAGGALLWPVAGVAFSSRGDTGPPVITAAGDAGVIAAWREDRDGDDVLFAQRLGPAGNAQWTAGGVQLGGPGALWYGPAIAPDGAGGAVVAWQDRSDFAIRAQRVGAEGDLQWAPAGEALAGLGQAGVPMVIGDDAGGAIIAWTASLGRLLAQRLSASGEQLWSRGGAVIGIREPEQLLGGLVGDGTGGAVLAWVDDRGALAQGIAANGAAFRSEPVIEGVHDVAADQGGRVQIRWTAGNLDLSRLGDARYDVWRRAEAVGEGAASWDRLGTVMARGGGSYVFNATTPADSCAAGAAPSTFRVDYHLPAWDSTWEAAPASGWSVDNLAPAPPANVRLAPGRRLAWDEALEPDFRQYTIYGSGVGELDGSAVVVARTTDTRLEVGDLAYPFLLVTAADIHDNESAAGGTSAPISLRVHDAAPNPFNPQVTITFDLPRAGRARLDVHDAAGRLVRRLVEDDLAAGRHVATWDGRAGDGREAASGVYIVRLEAAGGAQARKVTLLR